jgi:hypothetical protein
MKIKTVPTLTNKPITSSDSLDTCEEPILLSIFTGKNSILIGQYKVILLEDKSPEQILSINDADFRLEECNDC